MDTLKRNLFAFNLARPAVRHTPTPAPIARQYDPQTQLWMGTGELQAYEPTEYRKWVKTGTYYWISGRDCYGNAIWDRGDEFECRIASDTSFKANQC